MKLFLSLLVALFPGVACAQNPLDDSASPGVTIRTAPRPFVRIVSGSLVLEEQLLKGGWRTHYWSPTGVIKPDRFVDNPVVGELPGVDEPIACSFGLSVDGQELWDGWRFESAREVSGSGARNSVREVVVELVNSIRPVRVRVHTRFDGKPFVMRWLEIRNEGKTPAAIGSVQPMSGYLFGGRNLKENLPAGTPSAFSVFRPATLEAVREADFRWFPLPDGTYSWGAQQYGLPFTIVKNGVTGESFLFHFAWSANYTYDFYNLHNPSRNDAFLYFRVGFAGPGPFRVLRRGESVSTPALHVGHFLEGMDASIQQLHSYLRESVLPPLPAGRVRPVEFNSWGYAEDNISEESLKNAIDTAAGIGAELFTIDAGWYADEKTSWWLRVGDWRVGKRLPSGLEPIFSYAREKGLQCGLWFDIERIGAESELIKQHPDWVVKVHGSREGQSILDFTNPEVVRFAEETLAGFIQRYKLDVFRLDNNANQGRGGTQNIREGFVENNYWRYYDAIYAMYGRLRKRFPNLMMENCAGGGGRNDLGMLSNFHWAQISDEWGGVRTLKILNGFTFAFPPEWAQTYYGVLSPENHRYGDVDFRFRTLMFGQMAIGGVAPSMKQFPPALRDRMRHDIALYKTFVRPMLPTAKVYHHTPVVPNTEAGSWVVLEHASPDHAKAYAGIFRLAAAQDDYYLFRPRGLDPARTYKVTYDNSGASVVRAGDVLQEQGVRVHVGQALRSELLLFEVQ